MTARSRVTFLSAAGVPLPPIGRRALDHFTTDQYGVSTMHRLKTVFTGLMLLCAGLATSLHAQENGSKNATNSPQGPQKRALLVGINDYSFVNDLYYCGHDIQTLRERLIAAGFPDENVILLRDGSDQSKYQPCKTNVERELDSIINSADPGDLILVAFSGHGLHIDGTSYLCPIEAQFDNAEKTLISLDYVYRRLKSCRAGHRLLLVDACRNDPRPGGQRAITTPTTSLDAFSQALESPPEGILVFTSCKPGQVSIEDEDLQHGVFMYFVQQGLEGEADRNEGNFNERISLLELYDFSSLKTKTYVARTRNIVQTPMLRGEITGDYEIAFALPRHPQKLPSRFFRQAAGSLSAILSSDPDVITAGNPQALMALRQSYDLLIEDSPILATKHVTEADCHKAIAACSEAIRLEPQNPFAYLLRGIAYRKRGDFSEALADFQKLGMPFQVQVLPGSPASVELIADGQVTGTVRANDKLTVTDVRGDLLQISSVIPLGRIGGRADKKNGWIHKQHISPELQSPDFSAEPEIQRIVDESDRLGMISADNPQAIEALQRAHDILAENPYGGDSVVRKDVTKKECDLAIAACNEALRLEPENGSAYALRGFAYRKKHDLPHALADFQKVGKPLQVPVTSRSAQLRTEDRVTTSVAFGDMLNVTQIEDDLLWVESVRGKDIEPGWIDSAAIQERPQISSRGIEREFGQSSLIQEAVVQYAISYGLSRIPGGWGGMIAPIIIGNATPEEMIRQEIRSRIPIPLPF